MYLDPTGPRPEVGFKCKCGAPLAAPNATDIITRQIVGTGRLRFMITCNKCGACGPERGDCTAALMGFIDEKGEVA